MMSQGTGTVERIKMIDGTIVDLAVSQSIDIPDLTEVYIKPEVSDFTGSVELISGTVDEYRLTMNMTT